ncbi:hypothetical protein F5Y10DRAFT_291564 [Nemania abortiva]|nr:hypothetical protein F5Y10DRAFT_291564 [Nemania abortiva]
MTAALSRTLDNAQRASDQVHHRTSKATDDGRRQQKQLQPPHYTYPTANSLARSLSSRSKLRLRRTLASHKCCPDVAATDPAYITQLWESVMAYGAEIESSKGAGKKESTAKLSDSDFETTVLIPYGITIKRRSLTENFYGHFSLSGLPVDCIERFIFYKKQFALNIWLEPDDENSKRIQEEFYAMNGYFCNEAEFTAYALQEVLLDERRYPKSAEPTEILMAPVRTLQLVQKPTSPMWDVPTRLASSEKRYDWNIRPDCAYYISLRAFPFDFRHDVKEFVSVVQKRACCPYLTIGFQKYLETPETATNQVAIASAIALYNRWRLKHEALQKLGIAGDWPENHKNQLRHYSITFVEAAWELWYTTPKTYDVWSGCTMFRMKSGDCHDANSIVLLLGILNDIHYWGLTVHGKSCLVDIDTLVNGNIGN